MRLRSLLLTLVLACAPGLCLRAQDAAASAATDPATQAVAAYGTGAVTNSPPDFVEYLLDLVLGLFGVDTAGNTWHHWAAAGLILLISYLLRRVVAQGVFVLFKRLTARTQTTLDDELVAVWEKPVAAFITVLGAILAIKVLKLSPEATEAAQYFKIIAFSVVALWFFISSFSCVLDHIQGLAKSKGKAVAAFMPWIKKTLLTLILIFGVLIAAQALGANVKAFLAGLGIGGLAFALAAQDTIANVFGSVVVAVDQPFRLGDFVKIGAHEGSVEEIGLRSTRLRTPDRTVITIPNKTVAAEAIINHARITQRRVVQTIGVTYSAKPDQIDGLVADIRAMLANDEDVLKGSALVHFLNFGASSLDIQIIYYATGPDGVEAFELRHRINLALMKLVEARGLGFAFPTQTIELSGPIAERLAGGSRKPEGGAESRA